MHANRIQELETKIFKARNDYYNGVPTVSDKVFDAWVSADQLKSGWLGQEIRHPLA